MNQSKAKLVTFMWVKQNTLMIGHMSFVKFMQSSCRRKSNIFYPHNATLWKAD